MSAHLKSTDGDAPSSSEDLAKEIRQMIAALEDERQALASLDLDGMMAARISKMGFCERLERSAPDKIDTECRDLLQTARQLNEVNRRVRNLLATNVSARIDVLSGNSCAYRQARTANFQARIHSTE